MQIFPILAGNKQAAKTTCPAIENYGAKGCQIERDGFDLDIIAAWQSL
jgi:hypothetical protein